MASAGRSERNKPPTSLNPKARTGGTDYGKNKGAQITLAKNPADSQKNSKGVIKQGTPYRLPNAPSNQR